MQPDFWHDRWREGRIGFHQDDVSPFLQHYWPALPLTPDARVLVPLCGKSKDMIWLASRGHPVIGVELSELAAEQFFAEHDLEPEIWTSATGSHYRAGGIEIICSDIFTIDPALFNACTAVYDRAALIALPADMRQAYVDYVYRQLPATYQGLLITLDYPQPEMQGPPFSVADDEVQRLYAEHSRALQLERRDILANDSKFLNAGVKRLDTVVYQLSGKPMS